MEFNTYSDGKHEVLISLDNVAAGTQGYIGMTSTPYPPLDNVYLLPGFSLWNMTSTVYYTSGCHFIGDLGRPWRTGNVIHLRLDLGNHALSVFHSCSGSSHTIYNVVGT